MFKHVQLLLRQLIFATKRQKTPALFFILFLYAFFLYFSSNNFTLGVAISFITTGILYWITDNLFYSLFAVFFITLPFTSPVKDYPFIYADPTEYHYATLPVGIVDSIYFSITNIWGLFLVWYLVNRFTHSLLNSYKQSYATIVTVFTSPPIPYMLLFWFIYFFLSFISASQFSLYSNYSINYLFHELNMCIAFAGTVYLFLKEGKAAKIFYLIPLALLMFLSLLGISQIFLLSTKNVILFTPNPDAEQTDLFARIWGISGPNGHSYIIAILLLLSYPFIKNMKSKLTALLMLLLSGLNIIFSQSRVVWLGSGIILAIYFMTETRNTIINFFKKRIQLTLFFLTLVGLLSITIIIPRLVTLEFFFEENGGGALRAQMISEGIQILLRSPWFGFGAGMNVRTLLNSFAFGSGGYIRSFPFPIHFSFIQIALEVGIPATIAFFIPYLLIIRGGIVFIRKLRHNAFFLSSFWCIIMTLTYYSFQPVNGRTEIGFTGIFLGLGAVAIVRARGDRR